MTAPDRRGLLDECEHGSIPLACGVCQDSAARRRGRPSPPRAATAGTPPTIEAHYSGRCPGCTEPIRPGDRLVHVDGEWVCGRCADEVAA